MKNILILGFILVSTNTLSDGKWLDWGESSMTNLDKVTSISGGILFENRCNNGNPSTLGEWIKSYRKGSDYYGGFYTKVNPETSDITNHETYVYFYNLFVSKNPSIRIEFVNSKKYEKWINSGGGTWGTLIDSYLRDDIRKVFGFKEHWLNNTNESYYSKIVLGDQTVWLSQGLCGDDEVTSKELASKLVQNNLDQIRDFLDDDDTYRRLK